MKILVLAKRQYMGKDLLSDKFGRFWELPLAMAQRGHQVQGIALSYRVRPEGRFAPNGDFANMIWHSVNLLPSRLERRHLYFRLAESIIAEFQPDIIWACSDAYHAILGDCLARNAAAHYVIDFYDNFESYPGTKIPGLSFLLERAVAAAQGVTCVSAALEEHLTKRYGLRGRTMILENAIRADLFRTMDRQTCRASLGLPLAGRIIGTAGSLFPTRGIETLYRAFEKLADEERGVHLALAGPRPRRSRVPRRDTVHDLGVMPMERVPALLNALDVGVVCNRDSSFGRYNFPQKAREMIACGVPIVGADVGGMRSILQDHPECLFAPDDPENLADAIRAQLRRPTKLSSSVPTWFELSEQLERFFMSAQRGHA